MKKINSIITFTAILFLTACATYKPQYASEKTATSATSSGKEISKTFYLIGNAGAAGTEKSAALNSLENHLRGKDSKDAYVLFLGNSFYPPGISKNGKEKESGEAGMKTQLDAIKGFKGEVVVLPGNRDWKGSVDGLELEEDFLKERFEGKDILQPNNGCPLESIEVNKDIQLIIVDTQWYLEDWDEHPRMNEKCEIKTRQKLFIEIEGELKKNSEKTIVLAMYHPLITYGEHGGKYPFIHPDFFSTLIKQVKTQGAISKQDRYNESYDGLMSRLQVLTKDYENLVFVSGLDKSLQYIEDGSTKQIVSGAGAKATAASLGQFGEFSYGGQGFAQIDIYKDGSTVASFYKAEDTGTPTLLFEKEIIGPSEKFDGSGFKTNYPATVKAKIYADSLLDKSGFYKALWGDHYREVYGLEVTAKVALLDTLYGGLKVMRPGGGHQTRSLQMEDKDGKRYNMRAMRKSAVQFIQTVLLKDTEVENDFKNTLPEELILDFYTAAYPYGAFTIPKLAEAADLMHPSPELYYIPKQEALGIFNENYGNELYMIEERPEKEYDGAIFNYADDVESTDDMLDKMRNSQNVIDQKTYIKARVFDMLVGDWDRHNDQWRWAEYKDQNGKDIFVPIPRDRDQVYSKFDGALLDLARTLFNTSRQFPVYDEELKYTGWFNLAGIKLDRAFIENHGKDEWLAQASFLQKQITDEVIEEAFNDLPKEANNETASDIKEKLRGRRDNLVKIAGEYYDHLAKLQTLTGTDKTDLFEITRLPEGETNIKIFQTEEGIKGELLVDRTYNKNETKEIWVYGLSDDDVFEVKGNGNNPIFIRIIGGQNNDTYNIANGRKIKVYDQKSKKNTITSKGGAAFRFTDNYNFNTYNYLKQKQNTNLLLPVFGYNPDDGFKFGPSNVFTINGFQQNPFDQQHRISAGYYFATQSFDINYEGEFANIFADWNFLLGGYYKNPNFSENYFGFGNETINPEYEFGLEMDYNRVRIGGYGASVGIQRDSPFGSFFRFRAVFEGIEVEGTEGRFITLVVPTELDETKYFATAEGTYAYESFDNKVNPSREMKFELTAGGTQNVEDSERIFGFVKPQLVFYNALSKNRKLVLKTNVRGQFNIGNNFEFYQGAKLGSETGLRGYRNERFTGRTSAVGSADLRYGFNKFSTALTPLQVGIFGGYDVGRVWVPNDTSEVFHNSYGGGFWVNAADLMSGTFNLFTGDEGLRFSFGVAFSM